MIKRQKNLKFRLYERAPMLICALLFMSGTVLASSFFIFPTYYKNANFIFPIPFILIILVIVFITSVILYGYGKSISILICVFMLLAGLIYSAIILQDSYPYKKIAQHDSITGKIVSLENISDKSITIILDDVKINDDNKQVDIVPRVGVTIYGQSGSYLDNEYFLPNSIVKVNTTLEYPAVSLDSGYYSERMHMLSNGIAYKAFAHYGAVTITKENKKPFISGIVNDFRKKLYKNIEMYVGGDEAGILKALLTGEKNNLSPNIKEAFSNLGISHLLATSGLHIGVLLMALSLIFRKFKVPIIPKTILSAIIIFLFMMLSGFRTSIVRASLMWVVLIGSKLSGEKYNGINSLGVAMFVMMLLNPFSIYDTSFVLSCMSVMAILLLYKPINDLFKKNKNKKVWQIVSVTACVMIFTWPVMAYYFNSISLLSPIYNVIFIPVMSLLLVIMIIFSLLSGISFLAPYIAVVPKAISFVVIYLSRVLQPFAIKVSIISPSIWMIVMWTIGIAILFKKVIVTKLKSIKIIAVSLMVISIISTSYIQYNTNKDTKINVYSDSSTSFVYLQDKDCRCIILNDNCYSVRAVLQKTLTNELDMLIFTGNDSCDFYKVMDDLKDEGIIINNIYVNEKIANEKYARNINAFDNMSIGDININVKTFKAKSKNAKLHYAAIIESDECELLYLDPRSLREGAFDNTNFDYVVSSKWSKSRMKNIQNVSFNNLIIKDSKYLYSEFVDALEQNGSKLYNINDLGAISLMIESEEE